MGGKGKWNKINPKHKIHKSTTVNFIACILFSKVF